MWKSHGRTWSSDTPSGDSQCQNHEKRVRTVAVIASSELPSGDKSRPRSMSGNMV